MTPKPASLRVAIDDVPAALRAEARWLLWRYRWQQHDDKAGRWTKIPFQTSGVAGKPNDPATWATFVDVVSVYESGAFDGIGFVLGDGWAGKKTKTRRDRQIVISPTLRTILDSRRQAPNGEAHAPDAYVFGNEVGEQIKKGLLQSRWRASCSRAKVSGLHFHDLRHEAASRFLEAGAKLHEVQKILGHTNISQTSTYLNASQEGLEQAMEKRHEADLQRAAVVAR